LIVANCQGSFSSGSGTFAEKSSSSSSQEPGIFFELLPLNPRDLGPRSSGVRAVSRAAIPGQLSREFRGTGTPRWQSSKAFATNGL